MRMHCQFVLLSCFLFALTSCIHTKPQRNSNLMVVEAKKWSKTNGRITHSDWTKFPAETMDLLPGFKPQTENEFSKYGGDTGFRTKASGYFQTLKIGNRWWIIDPEGYLCWHVGISGIRPGTSGRNKAALANQFGTEEKWAVQTNKSITEMGFNGAGCWSDLPLVRYGNQKDAIPLSYTMIWNFFSNYTKQNKRCIPEGLSFPVFDPEFVVFCDSLAVKMEETSHDPNLFGHFSDNELAFSEKILDECLAVNNPKDMNYQAAVGWLGKAGFAQSQINDSIRSAFLGIAADRYYQVVSTATKKHDPYHLYLGSRLHGKPKHNSGIVKACGKYADIISINYYGQWEPAQKHFSEWASWTDKPVLITEFYVKGDDSGLANNSGAGWTVRTQNDRGIFYENFCIKLLQMDNCVGWHWFRYMDNDPTDKTADPSNNDSNKGVVDNYYRFYSPLTKRMRLLNLNRYNLIKYFGKKDVIG